MSDSLQQWRDKTEKFVPSWYFEEPTGFADAVWWALSAMMQGIQVDVDDAKNSVYVTQGAAPILDLTGGEENIDRNPGELDGPYAIRIQNGLFLSVGETQLQTLVNSILNTGQAFFIENEQYGFYDDPDTSTTPGFKYYDDYYSRNLSVRKWYNWWTMIFPPQAGDVSVIRAALVQIIEENKAFGTTYDILYDNPGDGELLDEDGGKITDEDGNVIQEG